MSGNFGFITGKKTYELENAIEVQCKTFFYLNLSSLSDIFLMFSPA